MLRRARPRVVQLALVFLHAPQQQAPLVGRGLRARQRFPRLGEKRHHFRQVHGQFGLTRQALVQLLQPQHQAFPIGVAVPRVLARPLGQAVILFQA